MIDGSEKRNRQLAFELHNSHVCERRSKRIKKTFYHINHEIQNETGTRDFILPN